LQSSGQVINPSPQIRFPPEINCRHLLMLGKLRPAPNEKLKLLGKSRPSRLQIADAMDMLQKIETPPSLSVDFFEDLTHEAEHPSMIFSGFSAAPTPRFVQIIVQIVVAGEVMFYFFSTQTLRRSQSH
jgi:hypothetical protein